MPSLRSRFREWLDEEVARPGSADRNLLHIMSRIEAGPRQRRYWRYWMGGMAAAVAGVALFGYWHARGPEVVQQAATIDEHSATQSTTPALRITVRVVNEPQSAMEIRIAERQNRR